MGFYVYLVQNYDAEDKTPETKVVAIVSTVENAIKAALSDFKAKYVQNGPEYECREYIYATQFDSGAPLLMLNMWVNRHAKNHRLVMEHDLYYGIVRCRVDDSYYFSKNKDHHDVDRGSWLSNLDLDKLLEDCKKEE